MKSDVKYNSLRVSYEKLDVWMRLIQCTDGGKQGVALQLAQCIS